MPKVEVNRPCSVCGEDNSETVYELEYLQFGYPGIFHLKRCKGCGLIFNSPRLEDNELAALYGPNYYHFWKTDADQFKRASAIYERSIAIIGEAVKEKRVLEIGSGKGYFLAVLTKLGWKCQGVELSKGAVKFARERFGLQIFNGTLESFLEFRSEERFSLIMAIDLVEHVPDPDRFVASAAFAIEKGGFLVIDTPNADSGNIESLAGAWPGFNPFHIFLFNRMNLVRLLERHGFEVWRAFTYTNRTSVPQNIDFGKTSDLLRGIKNMFRPVVRIVRNKWGSLSQQELELLLKEAANRVRAEKSHFSSEDSEIGLTQGVKGDNLVVIAKKPL